ncbi:MAG: hypothetical protein ACON5A_03405 [Candidatus Comchoanobacterales bacterium]
MQLLKDDEVIKLIQANGGLGAFVLKTISQLKRDYLRIDAFTLDARQAFHHPKGVIEVMPVADEEHFAMKWVTGHPYNPGLGFPSILSMGILAEMATGLPLVCCEMNVLTAIRTAAVNAMMAQMILTDAPHRVAIIGTGAQAEFQCHALSQVMTIDHVMYYDIDQASMDKFAQNMAKAPFDCHPETLDACVGTADVIVTLTAAKTSQDVFQGLSPKEGAVILATGGDCPGKTELRTDLLMQSDIVVPFIKQARIEGEIQQLPESYPIQTITQFMQYPKRSKPYWIFDSIGIAVEDYAILKVLSRYTTQDEASFQDPRDLFAKMQHQW